MRRNSKMLHDIIGLHYGQFSENDLANPYELDIVNTKITEVKSFFSSYDFVSPYTLENLADYCLANKIANWKFRAYLTEKYKHIFDEIRQYFIDIKKQFKEKNIVQFLNNFDFVFTDDFGYDLCFAIYSILPKYYQSLSELTYKKAINNKPFLILDSYKEYKSVFKKHPSLFDVLFCDDNLSAFLEYRMEGLIKIGSDIYNDATFPSEDVKNRIYKTLDELGGKILANTDIELALKYQITYKCVLKFFKAIASHRYNYYDEHRDIVDNLNNLWLKEKGQAISFEIPFDEIKKQFDNPAIPWYLKQIMLTHSRELKKAKVEHFCVQAMRIGKKSITELVSTNIDINDHFGVMTQELIGIYNNIYCNALNYYISNPEKWENFYNNTGNILSYVFKIINKDISQVQRQLQSLYKKGQEYLFNKELKEEEKQDSAIDFTQVNITLIERILRIIYIAEKKEANSFYNPDKLTLGILLNYYDRNNPLIEILTVEFMQYLSYCLIRDKDEKGREVGLNLRNSIAHSNFDYDKFNNANGILSLLILTGVINALFLYYNKIEVERNNKKISQKELLQKTIQKQNEIVAELKKLEKENAELIQKLKDQSAKIFTLANIDENKAPDCLQKEIEMAINGVLKNTPEYVEYMEVLKASDAKELEYVLKYIDYYTFMNLSRENLFSDKYREGIDKLAEKGFFLYLMSTPEIPENILCNDQSGETIGQLYALKLREIYGEVLNLQGEYPNCVKNAIDFFEDGNYLACSQSLIRILTNLMKDLDEKFKIYKANREFKRFGYYSNVADKILNYYNKIMTPLEKWDGISLNYFDLQRDTQSYRITDLDCVRLFMLTSSTAELNSFFAVANFILNNPQSLREVIERLNS